MLSSGSSREATKASAPTTPSSSHAVRTSSAQRQSKSSSKLKPKDEDKDGDNDSGRSKSKFKSGGKSKSKSKHKNIPKLCPHCETEHVGQPCPAFAVILPAHNDAGYSLVLWAQDPTTPGPSFQHNTAKDSIAAHIQMSSDHCYAVDMQLSNGEASGNDSQHYGW